jgi:transcriptional regulator with XRE-family HTH domain
MDAKGFNQTTLSKKSGIDRSSINRMLRGTRQPTQYDIGVLAKCFDVETDALMDGLALLPQVQRVVDRDRARTEQLLAAESARDEAVARADHLAAEVERLRGELDSAAVGARKAQAASDAEHAARLRAAEKAHAAATETSHTTIANLKGMLARANAKLSEEAAAKNALRTQVAALQHLLAKEQSAKASAGLLGGIVGMALGRSID